jgi:outer membrane protein OmpA-like peptidoglycan-associated protein
MNPTIRNAIAFAGTVLLLSAGCATVAPQELVDARAAYNRALRGPAAQVAPADLHKARECLAQAEQAFKEQPTAQHTRDLAYVAQRRAQLAEAIASQSLDTTAKQQADKRYLDEQALIQKKTHGELTDAKAQLSESERRVDRQAGQIDREQDARLEAERKAADAEANMKSMQASLLNLAAVKEEQRGVVITISGSVLFASDLATLLPDAQRRLDPVIGALLVDRSRNLVIEGHTDSRGSESHNLDLSQRRAETVRAYLIAHGYDSDRIQAHGIGRARPIADNGSPEGRANNRRVEIVVEPRKLSYTRQ